MDIIAPVRRYSAGSHLQTFSSRIANPGGPPPKAPGEEPYSGAYLRTKLLFVLQKVSVGGHVIGNGVTHAGVGDTRERGRINYTQYRLLILGIMMALRGIQS